MSNRWSGLFALRSRPRFRRWLRFLAVVLVLVLMGEVLRVPDPVRAAPAAASRTPATKSVPVTRAKPKKPKPRNMPSYAPAAAAWPAGGTGTVAVDRAATGAARSAVTRGAGTGRVGGLPVRARRSVTESGDPKAEARRAVVGPASLTVSVAGRDVTDRAGVKGVLFTVLRGDATGGGKVALDLGYSGFATAYGADYGGRLRLVQLPSCVLTTPDRPECQVQAPVQGSVNDPVDQVVSVDSLGVSGRDGRLFPAVHVGGDSVPARGNTPKDAPVRRGTAGQGTTAGTKSVTPVWTGQVVYALAAGASSNAGDFSHTSLAPSYSWGAGTQGGDFSYSIPLAVPPVAAGPTPDLTLGYSSGSTDGKTTSTNNQPSWIGEGWDLQAGYIERSFKTCGDDGTTSHPNDLCWFTTKNATMVFQGKSTRLVGAMGGAPTSVRSDRWHAESDDGSRIEMIVGDTTSQNGDSYSAYWKVTTLDGTQYFFGRNKRSATDPTPTKSTQNTLVYGNNAPEPGSDPAPQNSGHTWTYRWNLDYVIDPSGNTMTYFYDEFVGVYGNWNATKEYAYDITAKLNRIEYGTRQGSEGTQPAPAKVEFGSFRRCSDFDAGCSSDPEKNPDTPTDLYCATDSPAQCPQTSPTYWTPWRLETVTASVYDKQIGDYREVDWWKITPAYPAVDDTNKESPSLWFDRLDHDGSTGGAELAVPQMDFSGTLTANRVNGTPLNHWRLNDIKTGTGRETVVTYAGSGCTTATVATIDKKNNPYRCFPDSTGSDWFHKYVVDTVTDIDLTDADAPDEFWGYDYDISAGGVGANSSALWHFDSNEQADLSRRTWNDFAGFAVVTIVHGDPDGAHNTTRKLFHRGMDGDYLGSGAGPRSGTITDSTGLVALDQYALRGFLREEQTLDSGGDKTEFTVHWPTLNFDDDGHGTATRSEPWPGGTYDSYLLREYLTQTATWVDATNRWRGSQTQRSFDDWGLVASDRDDGDITVNGDETCTEYTYAHNEPRWMIEYAAQTVTTDCTPNATGTHVLSGTQNFYDGSTTPQAAPTRGLVTTTKVLSAVSGATRTWTTSGRAEHDALGRVIGSYDANDKKTTTLYTPADTGPVTRMTVVNPIGQSVTTEYEITRHLPTSFVDANGKQSRMTYDGLGRLIDVYKPHDRPDTAIAGYAATTGPAAYENGTTTVPFPSTSKYATLALPFEFPFYGAKYGTIYLSRNGMLTFTQPPSGWNSEESRSLPDTTGPNNALYPFWDNLELDTGSVVRTATTGTGADRHLVIDVHNATFEDPGKSGRISFSVSLYETSGAVVFNYTDIDQGNPLERGSGATIGVENLNGTAAVEYLEDQTVLADNRAITFNPVHSPAATIPDIHYAYAFNTTRPNVVSTDALVTGGSGNTDHTVQSLELYDGLFRLRQTQTKARGDGTAGRMITDTRYDERGLKVRSSVLFNSLNPDPAAFLSFTDRTVENQHRYTYDYANRPTSDQLWSKNAYLWQTQTGYDGDRTWTIPPNGGVPTMSLSDVDGRVVELRQYRSGTPPASTDFQTSKYTYDKNGRLTKLTDPDSVEWTNEYDLLGRVTKSVDPDKGTSTMTYTRTGQVQTTTDARNVSLYYEYDDLDRPSKLHDGTDRNGFTRIDWTYDTLAKGKPTSSTRHTADGDYSNTITGYNDQYQPLGVKVGLPSSLWTGDAYKVDTTYNTDGSVKTVSYPAAGNLPAETLTMGYDALGRPLTMTGLDTYVRQTEYYDWGPVSRQVMGSPGKQVEVLAGVDQPTGRLMSSKVSSTNQTDTTTWDERLAQSYGYDNAGNVRSIAETSGTTTVSNQCFTYDGLAQLKEAWTTLSATCQSKPVKADVGGPNPYWTEYTYTTTGSRVTEKNHTLTDTGDDTVHTYAYPTSGQRHTLTSVTTTGSSPGVDSYGYDAAGNTTRRALAGKPQQTLAWDAEGHLASVTDTTGTTSYVYDSTGARLVGSDPTGTTVHLPGAEFKKTGTTTTGTRFYGSSAVRTGGVVTYVATDPHGTGELAINAATLAATRRKTDPFGNPRGPDPAWPTTKGFVGGTRDTSTGLTHLGAREYDPATGRFISGDPVMDLANPQSLGGYSYAGNNPTSLSDPNGTTTCRGPEDCADDPCRGNPACHSGAQPAPPMKCSWWDKCGPTHGAGPPRAKPSDDDINKANDIKKKSALDIIIEAGGQVLLEFFGITDVLNCVTKGDLGACAMALVGMIPWGKLLKVAKVGKIIVKTGKAILKWLKDMKWAERVLKDAEKIGAKADDILGACARHSFDPQTRVLMADGSTKAIKDIDVGDKVKATDPATGKTTERAVTTLHRNVDIDMTDVTVADEHGTTTTLHTTQHHPFWDETGHRWVNASTLQIGHKLHNATRAALLTIVAIMSFVSPNQMRDLTVDSVHTYYVMAGNTPVLVHNTGCDPEVGPGASLDNITAGEQTRIQNAANKIRRPISLVGSRASGDAHPLSDWDYVVTGANSRAKSSIKNSLPLGDITLGPQGRIDIFTGPLNTDLPYITFFPKG